MFYSHRADGQLAQTVLKWDPGVKRWQEGKGKTKQISNGPFKILILHRISERGKNQPCSYCSSMLFPIVTKGASKVLSSSGYETLHVIF